MYPVQPVPGMHYVCFQSATWAHSPGELPQTSVRLCLHGLWCGVGCQVRQQSPRREPGTDPPLTPVWPRLGCSAALLVICAASGPAGHDCGSAASKSSSSKGQQHRPEQLRFRGDCGHIYARGPGRQGRLQFQGVALVSGWRVWARCWRAAGSHGATAAHGVTELAGPTAGRAPHVLRAAGSQPAQQF